MRVAIASDHGGFAQKTELQKYLEELGWEVLDLGPSDEQSVDYPDFAQLVAEAVSAGRASRGVLICGTGIGMAIAANKIAGIRAANVTTPEFAQLAREHNDANIVSLSGRFVDLAINREIVRTFLDTGFGAGRHQIRVDKIAKLES